MYEIRLADAPDHLLATIDRHDHAAHAVQDLLDATLDQLDANDEGATDFHITFAIYDHTGQHIDDITACLSAHPRTT